MIQFALILSLAFYGNPVDDSVNMNTMPSIEFSKPAAEFESGQPVYPAGTKATLRNLPADKSRIVINDQVDKVLNSKRVDVSKLVELLAGTYTVVIESESGLNETFGFTIK